MQLTKADTQASVELHPAQKLDDVQEDTCFAVHPRQVDEELAQVHDVGTVHPAALLHQPSSKLIRHHSDCNTHTALISMYRDATMMEILSILGT